MKELSLLFKALSDPTRRELLELLKERDLTPSEMLERVQASQPTLSHHLDVLKRAELVESERDGQFIRYSLNMTVFEQVMKYILKMMKRS